jgi:hypothetical protein
MDRTVIRPFRGRLRGGSAFVIAENREDAAQASLPRPALAESRWGTRIHASWGKEVEL